jgi:hypothetical protein
MRWLLVLVTGLVILWSGYWVVGSRTVLAGVEDWVAKAPAQGVDIKTGDITLAGYPNRFDLTVALPEYADPVTGWSWSAPFVQVLALSYQPWKVIVALPNDQTVSRPGERIDVASDLLRASIKVFPDTSLGLDNIILEGNAVALTSDLGWTGSAKRAVVALRQVEGLPTSYEFGLQVDAVVPDPDFAKALSDVSDLPPTMDSATADVITKLSAPLDRSAGQTRPQVESVEVKNVLVVWGPLKLHAEGDLAPDDQGRAAGRIDIRVTNWQHLVPLMVASGAVKPELSQTAGNMLQALAQQSPDPMVLALPLTLAGGWMTLGPFPLGPAPVLRQQPGL